jgi:hypothetical protein
VIDMVVFVAILMLGWAYALKKGASDGSEGETTGSVFSPALRLAEPGCPGWIWPPRSVDKLLTWGMNNSLWIFPMATSCCGIEFMAAAASRVDLDRMGTIVRGTPRQADVMVVAGTITVKMAPRVKPSGSRCPSPSGASPWAPARSRATSTGTLLGHSGHRHVPSRSTCTSPAARPTPSSSCTA